MMTRRVPKTDKPTAMSTALARLRQTRSWRARWILEPWGDVKRGNSGWRTRTGTKTTDEREGSSSQEGKVVDEDKSPGVSELVSH
eukprot:751581-Hanusia_phi.AAC.1